MTRCVPLLISIIVLSHGLLSASSCSDNSAKYTGLNRSIIIEPKADAVAANYPKLKDSVTDRLHQLIDGEIIDKLNAATFPHPDDVVTAIHCLQSGLSYYGRSADVTNTPMAMLVHAKEPGLIVAFEIFRGGVGAPDTLPFLEAFTSDTRGWRQVASTGVDYEGSTFFVKDLAAPSSDQSWFLLWGRTLGAVGVGLRLEVVSFNGTSLNTIWQETTKPSVSIAELLPDHLVIEGESTNGHRRAEEFRDRYDVVPEGLRKVEHTVTKSY